MSNERTAVARLNSIPSVASNLFTTANLPAASPITRRRNLSIVAETRNDQTIASEILDETSPSKIYMCSVNGVLSGVQVWYGEYSPIAGKMHGDLGTSDNCNEYVLADPVEEVHIYKQLSPP